VGHMKDYSIRCANAAAAFRSLPFAFIGEDEARRLADQILNGEVRNAMDALRDDMHTHYECGNMIKHDREDAVYHELVSIALQQIDDFLDAETGGAA
jgi:hypothetical protein